MIGAVSRGVLSSTPAAIGEVPGYNTPFALGQPAHLTLVDPEAHRAVQMRYSRSQNNPYEHLELPGEVRYTFYAGAPTVAGAEVLDPERVGASR